MSMMEQIIKQYSSGAYQLDKYRKSLDTGNLQQAEEYKTVSGMLSDMRYAIDWMKRGRRPGNRRGAERKDIYRQRELYTQLQPVEMSDDEKRKLAIMLLQLTERERQCYLLFFAQGLTQEKIGDMLELSIRSVRSYIDRAKSKVQQGITD